MKIESCRFECSAFAAKDEPKAPGPHVAFLGRSNVGKSSWINRLLGKQGLARTSSTPGRTQSVNFYRINDAVWFVDLPGYGYAKVPERVRREWGPMVEGYLERHREHLAIGILLVDARHEATDMDKMMKTWLEDRDVPHLVVATKADKLSGNERAKSAAALKRAFPDETEGPVMVSAETGLGVAEVWRHLDAALREGRR
ncbi:MAG TPA: ribosome biogenesis GTP-binding protein YihA/YsxC [Candidatus Polarisedimenticolaceae bacterium]